MSKTKATYKVVQDENISALVNKVNNNLEAGFELVGGICDCLVGTTYQGTGLKHIYSQAMIYENKDLLSEGE